MEKIITEIKNFCPLMDTFNTMEPKKIEYLNEVLKLINWDELQFEIIDNQESKGDMFLYWYFIRGEKVPRLKVLKSENVTDIILDENNNPTTYIYEEEVVSEFVNKDTASVTSSSRTVKWIFERGKVTTLDPVMEDGKYTYDNEGNIVYNVVEIPNRIKYKDLFQIIHIPSYKSQSEKFSKISAEEYVDECIILDDIHSDWRNINHNAGFPKIFGIDIESISNGSVNSPAGIIMCKSASDGGTNQGKLTQIQITNSLESIEKEKIEAEENLYRKAGLIRPQLELKLGSSDSSRVTAQLRLPLELKLTKYLTQIAEKMAIYFDVCLKEAGLWKKKDKSVTLILPSPILKQSIYDELLIKAQQMALEEKTRKQLDRENGLSEDEIEKKDEELKEQAEMKIESKEVKDTVANANGLDNNFKSGV